MSKIESPLEIQLAEDQLRRYHSFTAEFDQINVIMGANGAGKSSIFQTFATRRTDLTLLFVEGGRVVTPPVSLDLTQGNFEQFSSLEKTEMQHKQLQRHTLSSRVLNTFILLKQQGERLKQKHSDEVSAWLLTGQAGPCPKVGDDPLQKLFDLFNELFPEITLELTKPHNQIYCKRGNQSTYPVQSLSDGEKQCLNLIADIALLSEAEAIILVDEPELNLHPGLAIRLWSLIEAERPEARFIYATHSIGFALRSEVQKLYILSRQAGGTKVYTNISDLPKDETEIFLGAISGILTSNRALAVEGKDSSLDTVFYHWLLEDDLVQVSPLEDCNKVIAACKQRGLWKAIAPTVTIGGIVDRDFKSQPEIDEIKRQEVTVLDFHEVESYLCLPDLPLKNWRHS